MNAGIVKIVSVGIGDKWLNTLKLYLFYCSIIVMNCSSVLISVRVKFIIFISLHFANVLTNDS